MQVRRSRNVTRAFRRLLQVAPSLPNPSVTFSLSLVGAADNGKRLPSLPRQGASPHLRHVRWKLRAEPPPREDVRQQGPPPLSPGGSSLWTVRGPLENERWPREVVRGVVCVCVCAPCVSVTRGRIPLCSLARRSVCGCGPAQLQAGGEEGRERAPRRCTSAYGAEQSILNSGH